MCDAKYDLQWWLTEPYTEKHDENSAFHRSIPQELTKIHSNPTGLIMNLFEILFQVRSINLL